MLVEVIVVMVKVISYHPLVPLEWQDVLCCGVRLCRLCAGAAAAVNAPPSVPLCTLVQSHIFHLSHCRIFLLWYQKSLLG